MGIKGLFTFIQNCAEDALEWHKLKDCKVVIDGNNLAFDLYSCSSKINKACGGDYDAFASEVISFFKRLNLCNIEAYVLMDGGHPIYKPKFKTVHERMCGQIEACIRINPDNENSISSFPLMGMTCFVNTIQKCGISILKCDFEADDDIIVIAKKLGAYVLSNDSDFFLSDVPFIQLNTLNIKQMQNDTDKHTGQISKFIPCYRFSHKIFSEITGVSKELLPLLAPLLGNDVLSRLPMKHFYEQDKISNLRPISGRLTMTHRNIFGILRWLKTQPADPELVYKKILSSINIPNKMKIDYAQALLSYNPLSSTIEPWVEAHCPRCPLAFNEPKKTHSTQVQFSNISFESKSCLPPSVECQIQCQCPQRAKSDLFYGLDFPQWFVVAYRSNLVESIVPNLLNKNFFFLMPQIECIHLETPAIRLQYLIKNIKGILWCTLKRSNEMKSCPEKDFYPSLEEHVNEEEIYGDNSLEDDLESDCSDTDAEENESDDNSVQSFSSEDSDNNINNSEKMNSNLYSDLHNLKTKKGLKLLTWETRQRKKKEGQNCKKFIHNNTIPSHLWFVRQKKSLNPITLNCVHISNFSYLPDMFESETLSLTRRKKAFYSATKKKVHFDDEDLPPNLEFILFIIIFWYWKFKKGVMGLSTLLSLLTCIIMFYVIDGKGGKKRSVKEFKKIQNDAKTVETMLEEGGLDDGSSLSVLQLIQSLTTEEINCARFSLHKFHSKDPNEGSKYDKRRVHSLSEFQSCFFLLSTMNSVLNFPFPYLYIESFFSATFCYNVHKCFRSSGNSLSSLKSLFGLNKRVIQLFSKLYSLVQKHLPIPVISETSTSAEKSDSFITRKKKEMCLTDAQIGKVKKLKPGKNSAEEKEAVPEFDVLIDPTEEDLEMLSNNMFSKLLLIS